MEDPEAFPQSRKRPLELNIEDTSHYKMRALLKDLRPNFIELGGTAAFLLPSPPLPSNDDDDDPPHTPPPPPPPPPNNLFGSVPHNHLPQYLCLERNSYTDPFASINPPLLLDSSNPTQFHLPNDGEGEILPPCMVNRQDSLPSTPEEVFAADGKSTILLKKIKDLAIEKDFMKDNYINYMVSVTTKFRTLAFTDGYGETLFSQIKNLAVGVDVASLDENYVHRMVSRVVKLRTLALFKNGKGKSKDEPSIVAPLDDYPCTKKKLKHTVEKQSFVDSGSCKLIDKDTDIEIIDLTTSDSSTSSSSGEEFDIGSSSSSGEELDIDPTTSDSSSSSGEE